MPASQLHITSETPLGATLVAGGATFRTWAPQAVAVYIALAHPAGTPADAFPKNPDHLLVADGDGVWSGFVPGIRDGDLYRFYVVGTGGEGFKRDPRARELKFDGYPDCNCIVRDPADYPWHDAGFRPPDFSDLIIYQFHIGVFFAEDAAGNDIRRGRVCKILDVVERIEYFADLGVNAVMPLPFQEFQGLNGLGYSGTDLYSPEMDYSVARADLAPHLATVNRLLAAKGQPALAIDQLTGQVAQFKAFIDLCHLYGMAVIADVVYNHAGGSFDDQCLRGFDHRLANVDGPYLTGQDLAGGRVFDFAQPQVRQFLIDNAKSLLLEYHIDGLRYDEVTVIARSGGWNFAQDLTDTVRFLKPQAVQVAEYWDNRGDRWKGVAAPPSGMGFDIGYSDVLREALRGVVAQAAHGASATLDLDALRDAFYFTHKYPGRWSVFQCLENHDVEYYGHPNREPRIPALADSSDTRSWYARSRAKVATGLLLAAPGVPMIFMGQEFLEDKYWDDWQGRPELLIWWAGLEGLDGHMSDQHGFTRDMMWLRRKHPALRAEGLNVFHVRNDDRVIAFHRWVPEVGRDVVVVASFSERTVYDHGYRIGFPGGGRWHEVFNSDVYDRWVNPNVQGNSGGITADGASCDGLPASAGITLPANSLLVFARDLGDF